MATAVVLWMAKWFLPASSGGSSGLCNAAAMSLAVLAAARVAPTTQFVLAAALMVPCFALFPCPAFGRLTVILLAAVSAVGPLVTHGASEATIKTSYIGYARMALAVDLMILPPRGAALPKQFESIVAAMLLVLTLGLNVGRSYYYVGVYPALFLLFTPATTMGPWGIFGMAASTALGLCAVKDESMELFLLLSHCLLHLAAPKKKEILPPRLWNAATAI